MRRRKPRKFRQGATKLILKMRNDTNSLFLGKMNKSIFEAQKRKEAVQLTNGTEGRSFDETGLTNFVILLNQKKVGSNLIF